MTLWRHTPELVLRSAIRADIPALAELIDRSARTLCARAYNERQMRSWMKHAFFVDEALIDDGAYCVAEVEGRIIGAGGWSRRKRLFQGESGEGADGGAVEDVFANPPTDPARLRMFFIDPGWTRRGIGRRVVEYCEAQAIDAGFRHFELMATLTGEPLYAACGYAVLERVELRLRDGVMVEGVRMSKYVGQPGCLQPICESPASSDCDAPASRSVSNSANGSKI
jgi:GNAT superfamily N-acetyltransferase